jgi:hypothetical protein
MPSVKTLPQQRHARLIAALTSGVVFTCNLFRRTEFRVKVDGIQLMGSFPQLQILLIL